MKNGIKRICGGMLAVFVMAQVVSGALPVEADEAEEPALVETVQRADGSVASLEETEAQRTMTVTSPEGTETTTVEQADGSVATISQEGARVRMALSLSEEAVHEEEMVVPFALPKETQEGRLSLELAGDGQATLALPLPDDGDVSLWTVDREGRREPLAAQMQENALIFTLASGQTAAFKFA